MLLHFWVGNITGCVFSTTKSCPVNKSPDRLKYLGFTEDIGWPKKLNTGRILLKSNSKKMRKQKKRRKKLS